MSFPFFLSLLLRSFFFSFHFSSRSLACVSMVAARFFPKPVLREFWPLMFRFFSEPANMFSSLLCGFLAVKPPLRAVTSVNRFWFGVT